MNKDDGFEQVLNKVINKKKRGRKSKWQPDMAERAYKLSLLGLKDKELCFAFGISEKLLNLWKKQHPEFLQSIKKGKLEADGEIAKSLYHRAKGYEHPDVHISNYQGEITITPIVKYYPPDTAAAFIWLKNRQKELWQDMHKVESKHIDRKELVIEIKHQDIEDRIGQIENDMRESEQTTIH